MSLFTPLSASFLGFDRLFDDVDRMLEMHTKSRAASTNMYPPLNVYKEEDGYTIEMAVAGFKKSHIKIEHNKKKNLLSVTGDNAEEPQDTGTLLNAEVPKREVIRRSIAARKFSRTFNIADHLEVQDASLEDGILTIRLVEVVTEDSKPLLIPLK